MNRNLTVGVFVLLGLALFTTGLFLIGDRHEAFQKHLTLYTAFSDLSGLAKGSKVQVGGMDAGRIEEIDIPSSPSSKFRIRFRINETFHGLIRRDSIASITSEGVVGDTFLSIEPGSSASPAALAESTLGSKEPIELADVVNQAKATLGDVDLAVRNANGLLTSVGGNLNSTLIGTRGTLADADDVISGLKHGDGAAGMLLRDPAFADSIRRTVTNAEQATSNLRSTAEQANALLRDISSRNFPQKVDDTIVSVQDAASNFDLTSKSVKHTVAELTEPDEYGVTAGANMREALSNVNIATGNLSDDSEALKHNFLVRGFFHKRGYYTLTDISPAAYRRDPMSKSGANQRTWLNADQLFGRNKKDTEELSQAGKEAIDSALVGYGDSVLGDPIIVEGYSTDESTVERLELSRMRALIVRDYILGRFHLNPTSIGAVALASQPPEGAGREEWNGISIVRLAKGH